VSRTRVISCVRCWFSWAYARERQKDRSLGGPFFFVVLPSWRVSVIVRQGASPSVASQVVSLLTTVPHAMFIDPRSVFDRALIGIAFAPRDRWASQRESASPVAVYSYSAVVSCCLEQCGLGTADRKAREDAEEYVDENVLGAWVGPGTPAFLDDRDGWAGFL